MAIEDKNVARKIEKKSGELLKQQEQPRARTCLCVMHFQIQKAAFENKNEMYFSLFYFQLNGRMQTSSLVLE